MTPGDAGELTGHVLIAAGIIWGIIWLIEKLIRRLIKKNVRGADHEDIRNR